MAAALAAMALVLAAPPAGSQETPDPVQAPTPAFNFTGGCDAETGELVLSWELSNDTTEEMTFPVVLVELTLGPSSTVVDERIDLADLFPTELSPGESASIGPVTFPGDKWWKVNLSIEVAVEGFDVPGFIGSTDEPPAPPCVEPVEPPPPAQPVEEPPRFTG